MRWRKSQWKIPLGLLKRHCPAESSPFRLSYRICIWETRSVLLSKMPYTSACSLCILLTALVRIGVQCSLLAGFLWATKKMEMPTCPCDSICEKSCHRARAKETSGVKRGRKLGTFPYEEKVIFQKLCNSLNSVSDLYWEKMFLGVNYICFTCTSQTRKTKRHYSCHVPCFAECGTLQVHTMGSAEEWISRATERNLAWLLIKQRPLSYRGVHDARSRKMQTLLFFALSFYFFQWGYLTHVGICSEQICNVICVLMKPAPLTNFRILCTL